MTLFYVPFKAIQLLSETFFSKFKNKKVIWGMDIKKGHLVRARAHTRMHARTHTHTYTE